MNAKFLHGCLGKKKFRSHKSAMNWMSRNWINLREFATIHPYHCEFCGSYHLGHYRKGE